MKIICTKLDNKRVPSAPAVPLDNLCEMLDKYNVTVPCNDDCEECEAFDGTGDTVNCWKITMAKWMEEEKWDIRDSNGL